MFQNGYRGSVTKQIVAVPTADRFSAPGFGCVLLLFFTSAPCTLFPRKYTTPTSHAAVCKDISRFPSLGIVSPSGADQLLGWIMTREDGAIGVLRTDPSVRRTGYARALVRGLLEQLAVTPVVLDTIPPLTVPRTPFCYTSPKSNQASIKLFASLGFRQCGSCSWIWPVGHCRVVRLYACCAHDTCVCSFRLIDSESQASRLPQASIDARHNTSYPRSRPCLGGTHRFHQRDIQVRRNAFCFGEELP
jgi:GNAT superfamily N-acetyltransferase